MQVAISISEGRLSSATLMRRLRSNSRKNRIYKAFREVGRSARTVALLRYLADPAYGRGSPRRPTRSSPTTDSPKWLGFGGELADNDPEEQEKLIKFNTLLANLVVFHNALDISDIVRQLVAEGWQITADRARPRSPYLRAHISRFGAYATDASYVIGQIRSTPLKERSTSPTFGLAAYIAQPLVPLALAWGGQRPEPCPACIFPQEPTEGDKPRLGSTCR